MTNVDRDKIEVVKRQVIELNNQVEKIADRTRNMAYAMSGNSDNDEFVRLMDRQLKLTTQIDDLLRTIEVYPD